jgi:asparagine synthase (glutamine-hydrolysing)
MRRASLMLKGAHNIQPRATYLAWAHGLMVRTLFCHHPLANWTFQLSGDLWLRGPCEKYLLKRAVEGWLPAEIVWREKRGMGVPLTEWCVGPLWSELGNWLHPRNLETEGWFQPEAPMLIALGRLGAHMRGRRIGELLWLLLMWQAWRKTVLGVEFPPQPLGSPFRIPHWWHRFQQELHS